MNTRLKLTIGIVVFALIAAVGWYLTQPDDPKGSKVTIAGDATPSKTSDGTQRQTQRENDLALARAEYVKLIRFGEDTMEEIDGLQEAIGRWESEIVPLLTNEDGRHIASSDDDVRVFRALYADVNLPTPEAVSSLRSELDILLEPLKNALDGQTITGLPDSQLDQSIHELANRVAALMTQSSLAKQIQQLLSMASVAKRENPRDPEILNLKFEAIDAAEAAVSGAQLAKAQEEELEKASNMREEKERERLEDLRRAEEAALEAKRLEEKARLERQKLIDLVKQSDIQMKLAPFIQESTARPRTSRAGRYGKPILRWVIASTPEPMSYDAIRVYGVLDGERDEQKARERLQSLANHPSNTRTRWPIAQDDWEAIEEVRQLLIKLGPTLVELGYLRTN